MAMTASHLRQNIYRLLDRTLETGQALEIKRKGRLLRIVAEASGPKLSRLVKRPCIKGDPEKLVHIDWSGQWKP